MRRAFSIVFLLSIAIVSAQSAGQQSPRPASGGVRPATPSRAAQAASPRPGMIGVVDPAFFKGMQYRLVGPSRGGRVTTVTGVPSEPKTFYMGVASGGLFRTTDSGQAWTPIADGKIPVGSMGSI